MNVRPVGRPRGQLVKPPHVLTGRIRKLIDDVHSGRVAEASQLTGVPYPTMNDLYTGRSANPNLATLEKIRVPYGIDMAWLLGDKEPERAPLMGHKALLPPHPKDAARRRTLREILIPFAAWSMYQVYSTLDATLSTIPPSSERPIVADAVGDALKFRLATFLFQPLLAAEKAGEPDVIPHLPDGGCWEPAEKLRWIARLETLGGMWKAVMPELLQFHKGAEQEARLPS